MTASHRSPVPDNHWHSGHIAEQIATALPPHHHYIEVLMGTLDVLLAKPAAGTEVVNDADQVLLRFWKVLRERPDELARACALSPHSRADHAQALRTNGSVFNASADPELEAARRVWVHCCQSQTGRQFRVHPQWRLWVRGATKAKVPSGEAMGQYVEVMAAAAQRLHRVSLECRTPLAVITQWGKQGNACLYVDLRCGQGLAPTWASTALDTDAVMAALTKCTAAVVVRTESPTTALPQGWSSLNISTHPASSRYPNTVLWSNRALSEQRSLFDGHAVGSRA